MDNYSALVDAIIQAEMDGVPEREKILFLGETPSYIVDSTDFTNLSLVIKGSTIAKAAFDHGMPKSFLKRLPGIVSSPKGLYQSDSDSAPGSVVVLTFEDHRGNPVIIPIRPRVQVGRSQVHNVVTSIYGKEGYDPEVRWKRKGLLLWEPT